jgi:heme exporter protein B
MPLTVRRVFDLVIHEFRLEYKNKQAIAGLITYSLSSLFVTWLSFRATPEAITWNALFWIIQLFAATNAVARSFLQESRGIQLLHYVLFRPEEMIISKTIFSFVLLLILGHLNLGFFLLIFPLENIDLAAFIMVTVLGSLGLSIVFTLVSAIASRAQGNASLVAILGFPLIFPLLITLIRYSQSCLEGAPTAEEWNQSLLSLAGLDAMLATLSFILFPYLWRD